MDGEERKTYHRAYYEAHKEEVRAYKKAHKEEIKTYRKAYSETHKEEEKTHGKAYHEAHKEELKVRGKAYREVHKEEQKARGKVYYEAHIKELKAHKGHKEKKKTYHIAKKYGVSLQDAELLVAVRDSEGAWCDICRTTTGPFCIDHDHSTMEIRGILCRLCNSILHKHFSIETARTIIMYLDDNHHQTGPL